MPWRLRMFPTVWSLMVYPRLAQGADDPVVAPGAIFLCHAYHQRLQLLVDRGAPWGRALLGTVTLLGHERAVPAENRIGLDDLGHFRQRLLPQLVADLSQGLPLAVTQTHASLELIAEYAIFHIPPNLVVDQEPLDVETSSSLDFLLLHNLWTTLRR
jgi:hypothetical protein